VTRPDRNHPDGLKGYVGNGVDGTVSVFDTGTNSVTKTISVGSSLLGLRSRPMARRCTSPTGSNARR
jgi:YVTN family beta-propeller protein